MVMILTIEGSHYGLVMETKDQSDTEILHLEDKEEVLT